MLHPRRVIHVELQTRLMTLSQTVALRFPPPVGHRWWGRAAAAKYHTFVHWKEEEIGTCPVLLDSADETCAVSLPVYPKEHSVHTKLFPLYTVCRSIPRNIQLAPNFPLYTLFWIWTMAAKVLKTICIKSIFSSSEDYNVHDNYQAGRPKHFI